MSADPDHSMEAPAERSPPRPPPSPSERIDVALKAVAGAQFDALADAARRLAEVLETNADTLEQVAETRRCGQDEPGEHAARDRRLAAALREAAEAFEAHRAPSDEVRRKIRDR
jgi:hypothetical protein